MNIPEFNLNGFIKFPTKSQKKFKSIKWKVKGEEYISEAVADNDNDSFPDYLCFTAVDGDASVSMSGMNEGGVLISAPTIYYSFDKVTWTSWIEDYAGATINLTNGQSVYMYGENPNGIQNVTTGDLYIFQMTGKVAASGNIQTLLSQAGDRMDVPLYAFFMLFQECTSLTTAPKLPAITLAEFCYAGMFGGCTSLTVAPELPATTLSSYCYAAMFNSCTSLTEAPALPVTTLAEDCYAEMFCFCSSLTVVPELPATTLAEQCYYRMFEGCTALKEAPALPATTLAGGCYSSMFEGCTALKEAPALPATTLATDCYYQMFQGCSNLQSVTTYVTEWNTTNAINWLDNAGTSAINPTIYCPADSTIPEDTDHGIPTGWTRADLPTS